MHKTLLPRLDKEVSEQTILLLKNAEHITLVTDSWSNQRNKSITNYVAMTPDPVFFRAIRNSAAVKNAEYIAADINEAIRSCPVGKLRAVVTDNAPVMKKAWRLVCKENPDVACLGCFPHALNLFFNDAFSKMTDMPRHEADRFLVDSVPQSCGITLDSDADWVADDIPTGEHIDADVDDDETFVQQQADQGETSWRGIRTGTYSLPQVAFCATAITKFFRAHQHPRQLLLDQQLKNGVPSPRQLQLPGATRWGTYVRCIDVLFKCRVAVQQITEKNAEVSSRLKPKKLLDVIRDVAFWETCRTVLEAFDPLCVILALLEGDFATLSFGWSCLLQYSQFLSTTTLNQRYPKLHMMFVARMDFVYTPPTVGMAYCLDPRYKGKDLSPDRAAEVRSRIHALWALKEWIKYHSPKDDPVLSSMFLHENIDGRPRAWWNSVRADFPILSETASRLLSIVCNSASSERIWSRFSLIHTKIRNRLTAEKSIVLCRIYAWLQMSNRECKRRLKLLDSFNLETFRVSIRTNVEQVISNVSEVFDMVVDDEEDEVALSQAYISELLSDDSMEDEQNNVEIVAVDLSERQTQE